MKMKLDNIFLWGIPSHWEVAVLSDLGAGENAIVDGPFGSNLKTSDYIDDRSNGVPVLTTKNLAGDYSESSVRYISSEKYEELKRSRVDPGDILVAKIGSIGKTGIYPQNQKTAIIPANLLKFTVTKRVSFRYVYNYLNYSAFQKFIQEIATATAQPAFNVTKFRALPIPVPPLQEQRRIVTKIEELFSELDKGIESLKTARDQLKVYRQALLKHAFEGKLTEHWRKDNADKLETADQLLESIKHEREARYQQQIEEWKTAVKQWESDGKEGKKPSKPGKPKTFEPATYKDLEGLEELPAGWVCAKYGELIEGSQNGLSKRSGKSGSEFIVLRLADIDHEEVDLSDTRSILLTEDEQQKYVLNKDDLLCIRVNGSPELVGRFILIREETELAYCDHFIRYRPLSTLSDSGYLKYYFNTRYVRRYVDLNKVSSAGQNTVNQDTMGNILVAYCGKQEQQEIISLLEEKLSVLDALDCSMTEQLQKSEALRQTILKKAFSGHLVAQDPNDEPASVLLDRIAEEKAEAEAMVKKSKAAKKKLKKNNAIMRRAS